MERFFIVTNGISGITEQIEILRRVSFKLLNSVGRHLRNLKR